MAPSKAIKDAILGEVVVLIDEAHAEACAKRNNTYRINDCIITEQPKEFPWINRNVINFFEKVSHTTSAIKHVNPPLLAITKIIISNNSSGTLLSDLSGSGAIGLSDSLSMPKDAFDISSANRSAPQASSIEITQEEIVSSPKLSKRSTKGGRPKGTTNKQK